MKKSNVKVVRGKERMVSKISASRRERDHALCSVSLSAAAAAATGAAAAAAAADICSARVWRRRQANRHWSSETRTRKQASR